jgi:adenosylcobinamide-GDP ribazoletransferase
VRSLWLAVQFLTVVPVRVSGPVTPAERGWSLAWYPLVGAVLGLVAGGAALGLRLAGAPEAVAAAGAVALGIALTGGLHFDGLVDTCDGAFSPRPPAERLAIMRDPRAGSFGLAGGVCVLLVKQAALATAPVERLVAATVAALALSRAVMVGAAVLAPHGRPDGLGARMTRSAGRRQVALAWLAALAVTAAAGGPAGLVWVALAVAVGWAVARWLLTRLPGLTGDTYGALNELVEATVLAAAAWRSGAPQSG